MARVGKTSTDNDRSRLLINLVIHRFKNTTLWILLTICQLNARGKSPQKEQGVFNIFFTGDSALIGRGNVIPFIDGNRHPNRIELHNIDQGAASGINQAAHIKTAVTHLPTDWRMNLGEAEL